MENEKKIPVKVGERMLVQIDSIGAKGDGVVKIKGFVVFVPETKEGENYTIEIKSVGAKYAFGKVVE